jgi:hypothetical protein
MINLTGIDTGKALLEEIRSESQNHLLEPFLALTLTQADAVSGLHKCDIPTQLYLSGKLSIPEAILWLYGPIETPHFVDNDDDDNADENILNETDGRMDLDRYSVRALDSIRKVE